MKTIEFEGKKYEVEDWVNWVAMDFDGSIHVYEIEPLKEQFSYRRVGGRKSIIIVRNHLTWQDSLTKV